MATGAWVTRATRTRWRTPTSPRGWIFLSQECEDCMYPDEYPAPEQHTPPDQRYFQYPNEAGSDAETFPASPPQRFPPYTPAPSYPDMTPYTPPGYTPYVPSAPTPIATPAGQGGFSWPLAATILGFTLIVAITAVVVAYAFHGNFNPGNSGVSTIPQPTVTSSVPIVGATATATSDTTSSSACAHIAGYSNTQPGPSVIPQTFATDVPFPPDTLAYLGAPFNDGPYQFQIIYTCVASLTA